MRQTTPIIDRLNRARAGLEEVVAAVPDSLWRTPPQPGAWSAAEVIAHLTMVEEAVINGAIKVSSGAPRRVPPWKRLHLPVCLAEWRGWRAKTPLPLDPNLVAERQEMLAKLAALRNRTLAFLEENRDHDLSAYRWPHPFFGSLNFYDWFKMVAHHEVRHTKQLREIIDSFHK